MSDSRPAAVLFDMDGTLLDSEKVWDVSLDLLAAHLGGRLSPQARASLVGSNLRDSVAAVHADLGVDADPVASAQYLTERTSELFGPGGLEWKPGASELLDTVRAAGIPTALVTSTQRRLTEQALDVLGRDRFDAVVCGDEIQRPKSDPESYLRAAALLGVEPADCLAVEDSPRGAASAAAAGCAVLVVPSEVPVPPGPRRTQRASLVGLTVADLARLVD